MGTDLFIADLFIERGRENCAGTKKPRHGAASAWNLSQNGRRAVPAVRSHDTGGTPMPPMASSEIISCSFECQPTRCRVIRSGCRARVGGAAVNRRAAGDGFE